MNFKGLLWAGPNPIEIVVIELDQKIAYTIYQLETTEIVSSSFKVGLELREISNN